MMNNEEIQIIEDFDHLLKILKELSEEETVEKEEYEVEKAESPYLGLDLAPIIDDSLATLNLIE
jgi:hypothetical protein